MSGMTYRVASKRLFTFTNVATSQTLDTVIAKAIPVQQYQEATLLVRYHAGGSIAAGQNIYVRVFSEAPSTDDPASNFVWGTELASVTISSGSTAPTLLLAALSNGSAGYFGSHLRVVARGSQSGGGGTLSAYLSIDLSLKSSS
jgi:hypothetical protein